MILHTAGSRELISVQVGIVTVLANSALEAASWSETIAMPSDPLQRIFRDVSMTHGIKDRRRSHGLPNACSRRGLVAPLKVAKKT